MAEIRIPAGDPLTECKVCTNAAMLYGVVDFNKSCRIKEGLTFPLSGLPVYYYRCPVCDFLFTRAFDGWSSLDFKVNIYNAEYVDVDPGYAEERPRHDAGYLSGTLMPARDSIRGLDFGAGTGRMADLLRRDGYNFTAWDPFDSASTVEPTGLFNVISAFEVFEHSPDPVATMAQIMSYLEKSGVLLFTTSTSGDADTQALLDWWYVAPRNGHVSVHSFKSLQILCSRFGLGVAKILKGAHIAFGDSSGLVAKFL